MTTPPFYIDFLNQTVVQVADVWPTDDSGWETIKAWATKACDGLANDVGSASFTHPAGDVVWPGTHTIVNLPPLDIVGKYVRILQEDPSGTITDPDTTKNFTAKWWGKVTSSSFKPNKDDTGLDVVYDCIGLLGCFDQMVPFHHYQVSSVGDLADVTVPLVFNARGHEKSGNRSAATYVIGGTHVYVFAPEDNADSWTALEALEYLIALERETNPGGPIWTVAGATGVLDYSEKWDLSGMNGAECITRLANPRQCIGYRMEMVGFQPTIHIMSLTGAAISATGYTLPASVEQVSLDLSGTELIDFTLTESQIAKYDRVAIVGGADLYVMTVKSSQLDQDWDPADETALDDLDDGETPQGGLEKVFRRFKFKPSWDGNNHDGSFTLPSGRVVGIGPTLYGDGGYSAAVDSSGSRVRGNTLKLQKCLPIPTGYDWATQDPTTADFTKRQDEPKAYAKLGDGTWMTLAEYCGERDSVQIDIDETTAAITVGPADVATYISDLLAGGGEIYFTIAVACQLPLMVSWNRIGASEVEQFRSVMRLRPHMTRKTITSGSLFFTDTTGPTFRSSTVEAQSDVNDMEAVLALAVAWYGNSDWEVTWSKRGIVGDSEAKPGTYYSDITYPIGDGGSPGVLTTGSVVTRREWDFTDETGMTSVTTKRINLDIETVF